MRHAVVTMLAAAAVAALILLMGSLLEMGAPWSAWAVCGAAIVIVFLMLWLWDARSPDYYAERERQAFLAGERQGMRQRVPEKEKPVTFPQPQGKVGPAGLYEGSPLGPKW